MQDSGQKHRDAGKRRMLIGCVTLLIGAGIAGITYLGESTGWVRGRYSFTYVALVWGGVCLVFGLGQWLYGRFR